MKKVAFLTLLALALAVCGCGTGTPSTTVTTNTSGKWEAQLIGGIGPASQLNFVTAFSVTNTNGGSSQPLTVTGFSFINAGTCFVSGETESGSAALSTNSSNQVSGSLSYTVTSGTPAGNVLTLTADPNNGGGVSGTASGTPGTTGNLSNGVVWGSWTLTGPCISGLTPPVRGTFIMCQGTATCTIP
jgi:hypothetical protein